ncbi:MDR family MFS transporter [Longimicrobium sp.]|uniref:MDR family MFS transporter n=1 Tax=Longimicrobium sp. TaxID=2029185 RepID=UPI002E302AA2|nr:MDR family MFS transporter [Longimicrobium sp.]HEX6041863.1 MDR family MFS transporter [Longimicrobium sp.]
MTRRGTGGCAMAVVEGAQARPQNIRTVFAGLMLGMFLAAVNQTIVAPAMPRIVASLGGMEHYSWIAVSALLASTVIVPIVGKLSDLFGRKAFYVGGIVVFMASSIVAALAPSFEVFMLARVLEGFGMGTMMPLSQAIIGDLVPPRERGKYQGLMGGVFGLASVVGPFIGGWITDSLSWHWLFFLNIPMGLLALGFIIPFMKLPHVRRAHRIDYAGFVTLAVGLTSFLLAIVLGGTTFPWGSPEIIGMFVLGAAFLAAFLWVETRAAEPVMPLRLWKNPIFTASNVATLCVAMAMFGAIYYIPVFMQGVQGASVTGSGAALTPMMLSLVAMSTVNGAIISRTGRYKINILVGIALLGIGCFLLTRMDRTSSHGEVVRNMILIGLGLGAGMQTFVLVVQNAVGREDLGVATATTQLSRSIGSSLGTAILGTVLAQGMAREMARVTGGVQLPAGGGGGGELNAGAVLDPRLLASLPPQVLEGVRTALASALHPVFVATLPLVAIAFVAALLLREIPLRRSVPAEAEEAGKGVLAEMAHAGPDDAEPVVGRPNPEYRARAAFLGLTLGLIAEQGRAPSPRLATLLARLGEGDAEQGRRRLDALACALLDDCRADGEEANGTAGIRAELAVGHDVPLAGLDPVAELERAIADSPADLRPRLRALVSEGGDPGALLTPEHLAVLERVGVAASAAVLLDRVPRP